MRKVDTKKNIPCKGKAINVKGGFFLDSHCSNNIFYETFIAVEASHQKLKVVFGSVQNPGRRPSCDSVSRLRCVGNATGT